MRKFILMLTLLFLTINIYSMSGYQFDNNDFKLESTITTIEDFMDYYTISEIPTTEFSDLLSKIGMNLSNLDNYITFISYSLLISDIDNIFKESSLKEIKQLVFRSILKSKRQYKFLISNVIRNQDEILAFNSIDKLEFKAIILSKDVMFAYKEKLKYYKDKLYGEIGDFGFKNYEDLLTFLQNKAISAIKNRWERKFDRGDLKDYYDYGKQLNLDLELIEKNIITSNIENQETYNNLETYSTTLGTTQKLRSFMIPNRALKELSYRTNQMFFNRFKKGNILTIELDHDGGLFNDLDELLRGYYNHTTLTVFDSYVDLDNERIDPTENVFFSADRSKPVGVNYEQRSKYQYTYITHETPGTHDNKLFKTPEAWEMVRSSVPKVSNSMDAILVNLALEGCERTDSFLSIFGGGIDCPEAPPLRIPITSQQIDNVVAYALSAQGMPYGLTSDNTYYCSEVTWDAYDKRANVDLDSSYTDISTVTPDNIIDSSFTIEEDYWDYREEKRSVLGVCKYRTLEIRDDQLVFFDDDSPETIEEILKYNDKRSYYNCSENIKNKVKAEVIGTNYEEEWIREDKDEFSYNNDFLPLLRNCKNIDYSNNHLEQCFALTIGVYAYENTKPWITQNSLTCYRPANNHDTIFIDKTIYEDKTLEYKKNCVTDFDFLNKCKFTYHNTYFKPDFLDNNFLEYINNVVLYNPYNNNSYYEKCMNCFNKAKNMKDKCPDFINYY